ncbi:MAG: hypothetical protein R3E82_19100 [Pseudomonadales bacterium]
MSVSPASFAATAFLWLATLLAAGTAVAEDPKIAYWLHCAGCHGLEGKGAPPEVPTLVDVPGAIAALPGGREYLVRVPGVSLAPLSDDRLAEVVNYMLTRFSTAALAADFEPYTPGEIARFRSAPLDDPLRTRRELLAAAGRPNL